jgi:hypothetical protein
MENIYGNNDAYAKQPTEIVVNEQPESVVYLDCDRELTLMDIIRQVRKLINIIPHDQIITIYIVRASTVRMTMEWKFVWEYLYSTGRKYNVLFRGYFMFETRGAYFSETINVFVTPEIDSEIKRRDYKDANIKYTVI